MKKINLERSNHLDPTFNFITNSITPITFATPISILSIGLIKKDKKIIRLGIVATEALIFNVIITTTMKYSINRDRPFVTYPEIENITSAGSPSFPSGHTSSAFAAATSLSISFPKWYVITPSFVWASAMGYSRMHLGVHYPSDVILGVLVGSGSALLTYYINKKIVSREKKSKKI